MQGIIRLFNVL